MFERLFGLRPDPTKWKPSSNAGDADDVECFKRAAKKLGVAIKFGYPITCPAGASFAARIGMKGVYIKRSDADKEAHLVIEKHEQWFAMNK